jgi:hypothetical protein
MPLLAGPLRSTGAGESATSRFDSGHVGLVVSVASGGVRLFSRSICHWLSRCRSINEAIVELAGGWSRLGPASPQIARSVWLGSPVSLRFRSDRGWSTDSHL